MFAEQLNQLAERRRLLVLEADLHRSLVALEREQLRARFANLRATQQKLTANKPLLWAAAAAGLWVPRHWRKLARWLPLTLTAWRWLRARKGK